MLTVSYELDSIKFSRCIGWKLEDEIKKFLITTCILILGMANGHWTYTMGVQVYGIWVWTHTLCSRKGGKLGSTLYSKYITKECETPSHRLHGSP